MKVGIGVSEDLPTAVQQDVARAVEAHGLASLWTNEAQGRDALLLAQAWLAATSRLRVGVGVVPLWTRSPAQLAMAVATLQEVSGERFLLGLGVSHPATMEPWHDADFRRPLSAARDTLTILEQLLNGERADVAGTVRSAHRFRLHITPRPAPAPRWLAAMGPRMLELAGTHADGVLLNWSCPAEVERARTRVHGAATSAGRRPPPVGAYVRVAVDPDRQAARDALARQVGAYCALPAYAEHLIRQGFGAAVEAIKSAYRDGGPAAVSAAVDDDVLDQFGWYGRPTDDPTAALAAYDEAGLDHLVARVVVVGDDARRSIDHAVTAVAAGAPVR